ncbi:MAG: hypothetical protein LBU32_22895 [Clostridiales bacterium]|jgi:electron transfer flavoprotein alpha/beta subunit|nr:hypothetical protein [Clostridiales bacterium]
MEIYVCFKALPDFEQVFPDDWNQFTLGTDLDYAGRILGSFDESALEIGLRLKDKLLFSGEAARCTALTLSRRLPAFISRSLFAAGFDEVVQLDADVEFNPEETARLLSDFLKSAPPGMVLAGLQAGFADSGAVPALIACRLGLPFFSCVESIEPLDGMAEIKRSVDSEYRIVKARPPFVAAVGNSPVSTLRAATLRHQLSCGNKKPKALPADSAPPISALHFQARDERRETTMLPAESSADAAIMILKALGGFS